MNELVSVKDIELHVPAANWQEAVRKSGAILVHNGYVKEEYVDAMIETVETLGPYIVVAPGLAMPHARSSNGVLKSGISIITLSNPVEFGNESNDPVYLLIGLAGSNDDLHLKIVQAIATVFEDESMMGRIAACENKAAIAEIFNNVVVED